ncbi:hypothetical protein LCGC14_1977610 [marine sediment metagenome]|uniref:Uncharacterized protein n=1 Tax=marine sediment metagenome TaxID=412755 RepID=A0A0F9F9S7_9ZZZZ
MKFSIMTCPGCRYKWQTRTKNPKECPNCKKRLGKRRS